MNALTPIPVVPGNLGGQPAQLVDARKLHAFLEVGRDFSNWIKGRIGEFEFVENEDYLLAKIGEQLPSGTKWRIDYFLTLDMAKELAMVERTPRGRQARRYFIECERQLRQLQQALPASMTAVPANLTRAERKAINRQAWADVAGLAHTAFHARREALIQERTEANGSGRIQLPRGFRPSWAR
jgi:phage anti-repressor protein